MDVKLPANVVQSAIAAVFEATHPRPFREINALIQALQAAVPIVAPPAEAEFPREFDLPAEE